MRLPSLRLLPTAVVAAFAVTAGIAGAHAEDPIKQRQALMKDMGQQTDIGAAMVKGKAPFDSAAAAKIFKTFGDVMAQYGDLFPEGSDTGGDTKALPEIWMNRDEFNADIAKFKTVLAANASKVGNAAEFKTAFTAVTAECRTCHQSFKAR